jgi:hypothetical protein
LKLSKALFDSVLIFFLFSNRISTTKNSVVQHIFCNIRSDTSEESLLLIDEEGYDLTSNLNILPLSSGEESADE